MDCKNCGALTPIGQQVCDSCLNDWRIMRNMIKTRIKDLFGEETTTENQSIKFTEYRNLERLWKTDREAFKKAVNKWF